MSKRNWKITTGAFILILLLATGYLAIAAEYGSKEDPLVTWSYITDVLSPELLKNLDTAVNEKVDTVNKDLDAKFATYTSELDTLIAEFRSGQTGGGEVTDEFINKVADAVIAKMGNTSASGGGTTQVVSSEWKVITVENGKTMMLERGAEIVLRIGSGNCYATGSGVGLVNLSSGTTIANGTALVANNLYLVTIESGRGVKATSEMTVLVKGKYTIE